LNILGVNIPTNGLDFFIRSVEISSFLPGRIRLRSSKLIGNHELEREVQARLGAFSEIKSVDTNTATGSILIKYEPEILRQNSELKKAEEYIMTHVRRK